MAKRDSMSDRLSQLKRLTPSSNKSSQQDLFGTEVIDLDLSSGKKDKRRNTQNAEQKPSERLSGESLINRMNGISSVSEQQNSLHEQGYSSSPEFHTSQPQPQTTDNPFVVIAPPEQEFPAGPSKQELKLQQQLEAQKLQAQIQEQKRLQQEAKAREREEQRQLQAQRKLAQQQEQERKRIEQEKKKQEQEQQRLQQLQRQEQLRLQQLQIQEQKKAEQKRLQEEKERERLAQLEKKSEETRLRLQEKADQKAMLLEERRILQEQQRIAQMKIDEERQREKEHKRALRQKERAENPPSKKIKAFFEAIGAACFKIGSSVGNFIRNFSLFETGSAPSRFFSACGKGIKKFFAGIRSFFAFLFRWKTLRILVPVLIILTIAVNRLPSFIFNHVYKDDSLTVFGNIDKAYALSLKNTIEGYANEDFDGDGIFNSLDENPFDQDADRNGVIDSNDTLSFKCNTGVKTGDITFIPETSQCGVTEMYGYYIVNGYADGWLKIDGFSTFFPYIYDDKQWKPAEFEVNNGSLLVYIPNDYCYLRLLPERSDYISTLYIFNKELSFDYETIGGRVLDGILTVFYPYRSECPYDIGCRERTIEAIGEGDDDVMADKTYTVINKSNLSRFKQMPLTDTDLRNIYMSISHNTTRILSVQSDEGEMLLIAYGYDYMGNLYVADYNDTSKRSKIEVRPYSHLVMDEKGNLSSYCTVEISGMGIKEGSKIVLVNQ